MTRRSMSLLDVLAPPTNRWLMEISRRRSDLPAGVTLVRFGEGDDELVAEEERLRASRRAQPQPGA